MALTSDMLAARGAQAPARARALASRMMAVTVRALRDGYDAAHGGVFEAGAPGSKPGEGKGERVARRAARTGRN